MLERVRKTKPVSLRDFTPWDSRPNALGLLLEKSLGSDKVEIANTHGTRIAATPHTPKADTCANFLIDSVNRSSALFGQPMEKGDWTGKIINYDMALHLMDVFETIPVLRRYAMFFMEKAWVTPELKQVLFDPQRTSMIAARRDGLKKNLFLKSDDGFRLNRSWEAMTTNSFPDKPLIVIEPVTSHALLASANTQLRKARGKFTTFQRLPEPVGDDLGYWDEYSRHSSHATGATVESDERYRQAAPEVVARNVAWKLFVSITDTCWQALDRGLGQAADLPVVLQALREGGKDLVSLIPVLKGSNEFYGQGDALERVMENARAAFASFSDKTDWNNILLAATYDKRKGLYDGWEKAARERRNPVKQRVLDLV